MPEQKTKPTNVDVADYLAGLANAQQRADAAVLVKMMREITGEKPRMWGPTMIGFGHCHYVYASGHEGDMFVAGFAPRKGNLVIYFLAGLEERFAAELKKLGKAKASKSCLYVKKLADIDLVVLRDMIERNFREVSTMTWPPPEQLARKSRKKSR